MVGHEDIYVFQVKLFQPGDLNLKSGGGKAGPRPLLESAMGEISFPANQPDNAANHAVN